MNKSGLLIVGFIILILSLTVRGIPGSPKIDQLNSSSWTSFGPFELSPERGRFALTYSLIEDRSLFFSIPVARFAVPDLGYVNGKYVSLFAPAVSFLIIPGYVLGKWLGFSQVGSFAIIAFFAFLNVYLIKAIAVRLGAQSVAAWLGALVFIFASPAFVYAVNLYQHHISAFLMLSVIYILLRWNNFWSVAIIWFFYAAAISVDYPNFVLMLPLVLVALSRLILSRKASQKISIDLNFKGLFAAAAFVLPLVFLVWFNVYSYGNPFQLAGTVPEALEIDQSGNPTAPETDSVRSLQKATDPKLHQKSALGFFQTRNMLNGFYIFSISPDRGILYFSPVILFGVLGAGVAYRKQVRFTPILAGIIGINILLYSMWGDPWGGWAFGSRYLIPGYAVLSIFIAFALTFWKGKVIFLVVFFVLFSYSAAVNTLGAVTSSANPPQIEVLKLEEISRQAEKYTYARNWTLLQRNRSQSFVYQAFVRKYLSASLYYQALLSMIILTVLFLLVYLKFKGRGYGDIN